MNRSRSTAWLEPEGPIAAALDAYEMRPQQREMAEAIEQAFARGEHLAVEAGTGVGKSFAYLLPAIAYVTRHADDDPATPRRVVVSTHTIALQEQLVGKDLPFLRETLGLPFSFELVKGRNNYLSLRRLKQTSGRQKSLFPSGTQLAALHAIEDWAYETSDGSRSDMPEAPPGDVWEKVRSEHGNCLGRRCEYYEPCFYQRARRRAEKAQILVVNHALLVSDLALRRQQANVLPDYDVVVIDEAHTFERVATDHFGFSASASQVQHLLGRLFHERTGRGLLATIGSESQRQAVIAAQSACTELFNALRAWQRSRGRSNGRLLRPDVVANPLTPALRALIDALQPLKQQLHRVEDQYELGAFIDRIDVLAGAIADLLGQRYDQHVYWVDLDPQRTHRVSLCTAPLDVGPPLRTLLFDRVRSVVLTSATLAAAGDDQFAYLLRGLGSPEARTLRLGSPFDYERQVTVHVEAGLPDPGDTGAFIPAAARAITYYLQQTRGRAFVLFTSYAMLHEVSALVRDDLRAAGYTIIAQGEELSRSQMLARFRQTELAAIFGTDSFWQGVDVAGEALSNVVIVKLPFTVPDRPMVEARLDLIRKRGGNPFMEYQLPEAVLKFRQGFGRLIRSQNDRGIVVVLDPRVIRKHYGRQFLESLPTPRVEVSRRAW